MPLKSLDQPNTLPPGMRGAPQLPELCFEPETSAWNPGTHDHERAVYIHLRHVCIHIIYIYICVCVCIYIYMSMYVNVCRYVFMYACMHGMGWDGMKWTVCLYCIVLYCIVWQGIVIYVIYVMYVR